MSHLGTLLELEPGARLTDIALFPVDDALWPEEVPCTGSVYLHVLTPDTDRDPASLASANAVYLASCIAVVSGMRPDGRAWFATAQLSRDDVREVNAGPAADAALRRALSLTGTRVGRFKGMALTSELLVAAYERAGDVSSWSVTDLFLGLIVELTNTELGGIVAHTEHEMHGRRAAVGERRARLEELLESWSVREH